MIHDAFRDVSPKISKNIFLIFRDVIHTTNMRKEIALSHPFLFLITTSQCMLHFKPNYH